MHKLNKTIWLHLFIAILALPLSAFANSTPSTSAKQAIEITENSALVQGSVISGDSPDNEYWFEWSLVGNYDYAIFESQKNTISTWYNSSAHSRDVSYYMRGLSPNTQYRYRLTADNQAGKVSSDWKYFTTKTVDIQPEPVLVVSPLNARDIKEDSAIIRGVVAPHGKSADYWFEWGDTGSMELRTARRSIGGSGGEVEQQLSGLVPGTIYFFRMVGENDRGIVKSDQYLIFQTHGTTPPRAGSQQSSAYPDQKKPEVDYTYEHKKDTHVSTAAQTTGLPWLDMLIYGKTDDTKKSGTNVDNKVVNDQINKGETPANEETPDGTESTSTDITAADNASAIGLAGVNGVAVTIKKSGDSGSHATVEYAVGYKYDKTEVAHDAKLILTLPSTIVYIGDTTANELLIQAPRKGDKSGSRTYVLPIGTLKKGDSRSFSIVAMTTAAAKDSPVIPAVLAYKDVRGKGVIVSSEDKKSGVSFDSLFSAAGKVGVFGGLLSMNSLPFVLMIVGLMIYLFTKANKILKNLKEKAMTAGKATMNVTSAGIDRAAQIKADIEAKLGKKNTPVVEETAFIPSTPVPVKPTILAREEGFGLPGMEVVEEGDED